MLNALASGYWGVWVVTVPALWRDDDTHVDFVVVTGCLVAFKGKLNGSHMLPCGSFGANFGVSGGDGGDSWYGDRLGSVVRSTVSPP